MKTILTLALLCLSFFTLSAQDCNIGNEDTAGFRGTTYFAKNYLLGVKFYLSKPGTLKSLNLIGKTTESKAQMAVYMDSSGVPTRLIANSNVKMLTLGLVSFPVSQTLLNPGDYWLMTIYDSTGKNTFYDSTKINNVTRYMGLKFGDPIPSRFTSEGNYSGNDYAYFMEISCQSMDVFHLSSAKNISIFPNPSSSNLYINHPIGQLKYKIIDLNGRDLSNLTRNENDQTINIEGLGKGFYFLIIDANKAVKFMKH